jgi:CDP-diacylglycerol--serine O-phosphatidyltransferase
MIDNELEDKGRKGKGRKRIRKGVYLLPNLLTSACLFGGFYSVVASFEGNYEVAAIAILISAIFDAVDGRIARITGTSSKFGMEYDSLADLLSFGLAPGVLIFTWALLPFGRYGWLAAFLYVVCAALRLARFNVQISTIESKRFNGLPVPAAAVLVASTVLLFFYLGQEDTTKHVAVLALIYILALLMVSNIKYYSFKELSLSKRMPFSLLVALIVLLIVIAAKPQVILFVLSLGYVVSGPVTLVIERRRKSAHRLAYKDEDKVPKVAGESGYDR